MAGDFGARNGPEASRISLLGGFELITSAGPQRLGTSGQRLFALLALDLRLWQRTALATRLWPSCSDERAQANLRCVLWRLPAEARSVMRTSLTCLRMHDAVQIDVHHLMEMAQSLIRDGRPAELPIAVSELAEELLPGWSEYWVAVAREQLRQLQLHALEALSLFHSSAGRYYEAIEAGEAAVKLEPLRESAHRSLIQAHLYAGNRYEAIRQYGEIERLLFEELGIRPSKCTRTLIADFDDRTRAAG